MLFGTDKISYQAGTQNQPVVSHPRIHPPLRQDGHVQQPMGYVLDIDLQVIQQVYTCPSSITPPVYMSVSGMTRIGL